MLKGYVSFLSDEYGVGAEPLLKRTGVKAEIFDNDDTLMPVRTLVELLCLAVEETNDPYFGLKLAKEQDPDYLGLLGLIMRTSPNLDTALKMALRLTNFHPASSKWSLTTSGDHAALKVWVSDFQGLDARYLVDLLMGQVQTVLHRISKNRWNPVEVCFQRSKPEFDIFYRKYFSTRVVFNSEFNGFVFLKEDLQLSLPGADLQVNTALTTYAEMLHVSEYSDLVDNTKALIRQLLPTSQCTVESVAQLMAKDKRTLQRGLKERGTGFSALRDEVRFSMAEEYLAETTIPITRISMTLGYIESSSFSAAFKKSRGYSPIQWREQHMKSWD